MTRRLLPISLVLLCLSVTRLPAQTAPSSSTKPASVWTELDWQGDSDAGQSKMAVRGALEQSRTDAC
jgi:hypothetical protein